MLLEVDLLELELEELLGAAELSFVNSFILSEPIFLSLEPALVAS